MPQVEDGYTRIANELLEAILRHPFSKRELKVVFAVIRQTYGYNKKTDAISYGRLAEVSGLSRRHVISTLSSLIESNVINASQSGVFKNGGELKEVGLNKNYDEWITSAELVTSAESALVPVQSPELVPKQSPPLVPKRSPTKDNTKRQKQKTKGVAAEIPNWMPEETWMEFKKHRQAMKAKMTAQAEKLAIGKLEKLKAEGHNPKAVLEQSIENGWKGLFPLKGDAVKANNGSAPSAGWEAW